MPSLTISSGGRPWMGVPRKRISPRTTSPSSGMRRPEMARRVVVFPAPFGPKRAVILPSGTLRETPRSTWITSW